MKLGTLVAKRLRWRPNSHFLGIVVGKSDKDDNLFCVMWFQDGKYKMQAHLSDALIDLNEFPDEVLKARTCISA